MAMEPISLFLGIIIGLLLGGIVVFLLLKKQNEAKLSELRNKANDSQAREIASTEQKNGLQKSLDERQNQIALLKEERLSLSEELNTWKNKAQLIEARLADQKEEVGKLQEKFTKEFKLIANEVLEQKSKSFKEENKESMGILLNPLKERLKEFQDRVEKTNEEGIKRNTVLSEQIKHLRELNQEITEETKSLTKALKGDSKTQGNWGELQLESILEKAGLQKDIHYSKEDNYKTEDGNNQRLDYVINLPDGKHLILDSKVSLTAYSNYYDTDDTKEQERFLKLHMDSINIHIKTLSDKDYHKLYGINPPDYVLMFVANEPALNVALREDSSIYEKALSKNLVLVSTTTLLATLRTISYIWKQDLQNKNAEEIARQAANLYDKFVGFTDDIIKLGSQLKTVTGTYEEAAKKLSEGKGNLIKRTEDLKKLGVNPSKNIDQKLVDRSSEE
ncbi:MAG: DNA recombination protein RmuC [Parvicellaceae bacterium]|jgi:DNA recombination protein RmuC